jgi:hypothetical protein
MQNSIDRQHVTSPSLPPFRIFMFFTFSVAFEVAIYSFSFSLIRILTADFQPHATRGPLKLCCPEAGESEERSASGSQQFRPYTAMTGGG